MNDLEAQAAVQAAAEGHATPQQQRMILNLFQTAADKGREQTRRADRIERTMFALAAVVADLIEDARGRSDLVAFVDKWVNDLPHDARRYVLAYRHSGGRRPFDNHFLSGIGARDQFGALPKVPSRMSVMRQSTRTVDGDVSDSTDDSDGSYSGSRIIEG